MGVGGVGVAGKGEKIKPDFLFNYSIFIRTRSATTRITQFAFKRYITLCYIILKYRFIFNDCTVIWHYSVDTVIYKLMLTDLYCMLSD